MEKTSKFFKSLFRFCRTLFKTSRKKQNHQAYDQHQNVSRPTDTPLHHSNNHKSVADVAANVVVTEPHGANKVEFIRTKSRKYDEYGLLGLRAAVRIQAYYRGYLARKALRALKALVRLQALVRCLQALARAQARAREKRLQFVDSPQSTTKGPPTPEKFEHVSRSRISKHNQHSILKSNGSRFYDERNERILEMDTTKPLRRPTLFQPDKISYSHRQSLTTSRGSTIYPPGLSPSESYEVNFHTGHSTNHPNYMSYTESSRAKVRSSSARRQRPNVEVPSATKSCRFMDTLLV